MSTDLPMHSEALAQSLVREEIQALNSYHVPDSSGLLKLDAMENPNAWPGVIEEQWLQVMRSADANRYPDPSCSGIKQKIRALLELDRIEQSLGGPLDVLLGNGSDEIIQIIAMALGTSERGIFAVEPSFVMYRMISQFVGVPYHSVDLNADFTLDMSATLAAIETHNPAVVFLAVPNNPTGNNFREDELEAIITASSGLVVLDEAYMAFTESDLLSFLKRFPNVVIMRTFSKVGLAGLRLGFLVGARAWLAEFEKLRLPYNINVLTQASVELALEHYPALETQCAELRLARERLITDLQNIGGLEVFNSEANFVLVRCLGREAREVFQSMKEQGVLIKCLDGAHPLLSQCLRLTVGTPEQNRVMLDALSVALTQS